MSAIFADAARFAALPLAAPDPDRLPVKANVFERMRTAASKLTPVFSELLEKGCMVPAVACFTGAPGRTFQMFKHYNSVDEVGMVFGAAGAPLAPGMVMVGSREHFVNIPLKDPNDPSNYTLFVVVQRQWEKEELQWEELHFVCEQCQEPLIGHRYVCDPAAEEMTGITQRGDYVPFATLTEGTKMLEMLKDDPKKLTCAECGHTNKLFPIDDWGWHQYSENTRTVSTALDAFPTAVIVDPA